MKTLRLATYGAVLGLALACQSDSVTFPISSPPSFDITAPTCQNTTRSAKNYGRLWTCGGQVKIYIRTSDGSSTAPYASSVDVARTRWNNAIFSQYGLATLNAPVTGIHSAGDGDRYVDVLVDIRYTGATPYWCGVGNDRNVTLFRVAQGAVCPAGSNARVVTDLTGVAVHELGHGIGFSHMSNDPAGPTASCVMAVPATGDLNQTPCDHEKQQVYWVFGLRASEADVTLFLARPELFLSPTALTLRPSQTGRVTATVSDYVVLPALEWSISPQAVASISASTQDYSDVLANSAGSATLTAQMIDNSTTTWPLAAKTSAITVELPPVASVTIGPSEVSFNGAEDATLTATVVDTDGNTRPDVSLTWSVRDTAIVYFVPAGPQSAWVAAKRNGTTQVFARAPNGVTAVVTVTVTGCPVRCMA